MTKRVDCIRASGIRKLFDRAAHMKDKIDLSIGQPDFPVPEAVKKAMIAGIEADQTGYTPSSGYLPLKEKILEKYKDFACAKSVIVTPGAMASIFLAYSVLLEEGDELIVFDPYFVTYPDLASFLNINPTLVKTNDDFSINFDALSAAITDKTKAILVNSPSNPTGYVIPEEDMKKVVEIAKEHDLWIMSDEVYEAFDFENEMYSPGKSYEKTVVINGASKRLAMTGLRLGWAVAPEAVIDDMTKVQQYSFVCAPRAVQYGVAEAFDADVSKEVDHYKKRRDMVYDTLKNHFEIIRPGGAFYFFIKLPARVTGTAFSDACLDKRLLVVPGCSFSSDDDHFRISYAVNDEELKKGLQLLIEVIDEMKK